MGSSQLKFTFHKTKLLLILIVLCHGYFLQAQVTEKRTLTLMGSRFDITVVAPTSEEGQTYIDMAIDEISRIEALISSWDTNSQTSAINRQAGKAAVKVDLELFQLMERCQSISRLTGGAFDISYASLDPVWRFDGSMKELPSQKAIKNSVARIGFQKIQLDTKEQSVFLKEVGMKIGFGGIGKGYAADRAKDLLQAAGASGGIINASGDLSCWGRRADGEPWKVAITHPKNKAQIFSWLPVEDGAVVTSGDYEKYVQFDGVRYAHIINPKTGYPTTGVISATVMAPKAELADGLSTALFVLGPETGLKLINQMEGVECILVDAQGQIHTSDQIDMKDLNQYNDD